MNPKNPLGHASLSWFIDFNRTFDLFIAPLSPQFNTYFYLSVLPFIGIAFSALSFFIGHFSYPRVHNLKVYLIGYLAGLIGLDIFVVSDAWRDPDSTGARGLYGRPLLGCCP